MIKLILLSIAFLILLYSCVIFSKSGLFGDPGSENFSNFITSNYTMKNEKLLFAQSSEAISNLNSISNWNAFSSSKTLNGIVALTQYNLYFILHYNSLDNQAHYVNYYKFNIHEIKAVKLDIYKDLVASTVITSTNNINYLIQIMSSFTSVDHTNTVVFYNLLNSLVNSNENTND